MMLTLVIALMLLMPSDSTTVVVESSLAAVEGGYSLTVLPTGDILCLSQTQHTLTVFDKNGVIKRSIGGQGWGNYEFDTPSAVASSFLLQVYIADYANRRIQRYDKELNYIQTYDEQSLRHLTGRFQPYACAVSLQGDLFIVERDGQRILKVNQRGEIEKEFGSYKDGPGTLADPVSIAISRRNEVLVLTRNNIVVYDIFGNFLRTIPLSPSGWRNLQSADDVIIITSPSELIFLSEDGKESRKVSTEFIIGLPRGELLIDATMGTDALFLLTSAALYRCSVR